MIQDWIVHIKCPLCKSNKLRYRESGSVICPTCGWTGMADWNYLDMLDTKSDYKILAHDYSDLFEKVEQGEFGDTGCYYSKTAEEEFTEFLDETRLSVDDLAGLRILDAGCGLARLTRMLATYGTKCIALDIHQRLYIYAKKYHHPSDEHTPLYVRESIEDMSFESCFDVVWCQGVLSYVPDPVRSISELQRVVKDDGLIYVWIYHSEPRSLVLRLARLLRTLPATVREPIYRFLAFSQDYKRIAKQIIKGTRPQFKSQTGLHLRDWSIADDVKTLSLKEVLRLFESDSWEVIWSTDEGTTVRCLARKKHL